MSDRVRVGKGRIRAWRVWLAAWQLGNLANLAEFHLCVRSLSTLAQVVPFCSALLCSGREVIELG